MTEEIPKLDVPTLLEVIKFLQWTGERVADDIDRLWDDIDRGITSHPDMETDFVTMAKCSQYYANNLKHLEETLQWWIKRQEA